MAHRKRKVHHRSRRRRSMSGISGGKTGVLIGVGGGVVAAKLITKLSANVTAISSPVIQGVIQVGIGLFVPKFVKSELGQGLGYGMIATGAATLLSATGVLSGIGLDNSTYHVKMVNGPGLDNLNTVAGAGLNNLKAVAGLPGNTNLLLSVLNGINDNEDYCSHVVAECSKAVV